MCEISSIQVILSQMRAHVYIKPPSRDAETWTHEPQYNRYLNIRVHQPEELDARELRCSVTFRGKTFKTGVMDMMPAEVCRMLGMLTYADGCMNDFLYSLNLIYYRKSLKKCPHRRLKKVMKRQKMGARKR